MATVFDPQRAFTYGSVIESAYRMFSPGLLAPADVPGAVPAGWTITSELTAVDKIGHKTEPEFFGMAAQSDGGELLIAIRGTDTLLEWLVDAECGPCAFPGVPAAGRVEDGFCSVYATLRCSSTGGDVLSLVRQAAPGTTVTICGHSLGAAVATLLALDVAVAAPTIDLTLYTFASPRVGDAAFAAFCNSRIPVHFRVANRPDIVPHLPPLYEATGTEIDVDSTAFPQIAHRIICYHSLTTYLWLLEQSSPFGLGDCERATP